MQFKIKKIKKKYKESAKERERERERENNQKNEQEVKLNVWVFHLQAWVHIYNPCVSVYVNLNILLNEICKEQTIKRT